MSLQQICDRSCSTGNRMKFSASPAPHFQPSEWKRRVDARVTLVGLSRFSGFYPGGLSGDVQQRAAIARALAGDQQRSARSGSQCRAIT
jgi:ABC-type sulfate/molybdate transport systems ATPase subunit